MNMRRSLRLRLLAGAVVVIIIALGVTGVSLATLFNRHLERRIGQELDTHLAGLTGSIGLGSNDLLQLAREPNDPRFGQIFGGLYWQILDQTTGNTIRSRSLWDTELNMPADQLSPGDEHVHDVAGPQGTTLLVHERLFGLNVSSGVHLLRVSVAIDRAELDELAVGVQRDITIILGVLGAVLLLGFWLQVQSGLKPMQSLRNSLVAIGAGQKKRIDLADSPDEIRPLVESFNGLLDSRDIEMTKARDRAADLAHGLKTPLTALASDVDRLRQVGQPGIAADIDEISVRMRRHIDRELVRARIRHGIGEPASRVDIAAEAIIRTLQRTPEGEGISIESRIDSPIGIAMDAEDLNEILGNILENAVRHAKSQVRITAIAENQIVRVVVGDNGPGMTAEQSVALVERGRRLDSKGTGSGLGMAIVSDILLASGGEMRLGQSELGGLEVCLLLPQRDL